MPNRYATLLEPTIAPDRSVEQTFPEEWEAKQKKSTKPQADKTATPQDHKTTSRQVVITTKPQIGKTTNGQNYKTTKTVVEKYTTHLRPDTILRIKKQSIDEDCRDYELVQRAIDEYFAKSDDKDHLTASSLVDKTTSG